MINTEHDIRKEDVGTDVLRPKDSCGSKDNTP